MWGLWQSEAGLGGWAPALPGTFNPLQCVVNEMLISLRMPRGVCLAQDDVSRLSTHDSAVYKQAEDGPDDPNNTLMAYACLMPQI